LDSCVRSSTIIENLGTSAASSETAITVGSNSSSNARASVQPPGAWLTSTATTGGSGTFGCSLTKRSQIRFLVCKHPQRHRWVGGALMIEQEMHELGLTRLHPSEEQSIVVPIRELGLDK
jgi:hypothetical protein